MPVLLGIQNSDIQNRVIYQHQGQAQASSGVDRLVCIDVGSILVGTEITWSVELPHTWLMSPGGAGNPKELPTV